MRRDRADDILEQWAQIAESTRRPEEAPRPRPVRNRNVAPALGTAVAAVAITLVVVVLWAALPPARPAGPLSGTPPASSIASSTASPGATASPSAVSPSPSGSSVPSSSPSVRPVATPVPIGVIARIAIPYPDSQTAIEDAVAIVGDSLWIVDAGQTFLVRIDLLTDQVVATIPVQPSDLIAGDGRLWTVSPVGLGSSRPVTLTLSRVDLARNRVVPTDYPIVDAAGFGSLWSISSQVGLRQIDPETGQVTATWPSVKGDNLQVACGAFWFENLDGTLLNRVDPSNGHVTEQIATPEGAGRVRDAAGGCWVVLGDPGDTFGSQGELARLGTTEGVLGRSPLIGQRVHIAGDTFWTSTADGIIQRIDPSTAAPIGHSWQLPASDLPTTPFPEKFADWRLFSAEGSLWLITATAVDHLDVSTAP